MLPVSPGFRIHPLPLVTSAAYGLLIALIFTLSPLARARTQPVAAIFRALVEQRRAFDRRSVTGIALATIALVAIALGIAREPLFSAAVLGATAAVLALLLLLGWAVSRVAKRVPRPRHPLWRLALANLYRPGAQTSALVVALGLALTLFVTLAGVQTSLSAEIDRTVPKKSAQPVRARHSFHAGNPAFAASSRRRRRAHSSMSSLPCVARSSLMPASAWRTWRALPTVPGSCTASAASLMPRTCPRAAIWSPAAGGPPIIRPAAHLL